MTEMNPTSSESTENTSKPVRKKKGKLLKIVGVLVVLLIALVLLLPTIASLGPVRSIILSQANGFINGKIEVQSWSVGWLSATKVEGLKIYDKQNVLVLEVDKLESEASLLKLARGSMDFGKTVVAANITKLVIYPDGHSNLESLVLKSDQPKSETSSGSSVEASIPDVKVDLQLDLRGSVEVVDASGKLISILQLRQGSGGTIKIADINQGVDTDIKLIYDVDQRQQSTVQVTGSVDAIQNNQVDLANLASQMKVLLTSVDIGAAKPVISMAGVQGVEIDGIASGEINADMKLGQAGGAKGEISIAKTRLAMPQLQDVYQADVIKMPIDVSRVVADGKSRWKIDIKTILPEATTSITGDVPQTAIQNLQNQKMPGETGMLNINLSAKPEKIAQSLPKTIHLLPEVKITGGDLQSNITINLKSNQVETITKSSFALQGTKSGRSQSIPPISIDTSASVTDFANPVSGLRDLSASIVSDFANFKLGGATVTHVSGEGSADLDKLRAQLAQFVDLGETKLAGKADFNLQNVAAEGSKTDYKLTAAGTFTGIKVELPKTAPIDLPYVKGDLVSDYVFDQAAPNPLKQVKSAVGNLVMGNAADKPILDAGIKLDQIDLNNLKVGTFTIEKGTIADLASLQKMIDPFVPALREQQIQMLGGAVYVVGTGSADLKSSLITLSKFDISTPGLRIAKNGKELIKDKFAISIAGKIDSSKSLKIDLSTLTVNSELITVTKSDTPLVAELAGGIPIGKGALNIEMNLPSASRISSAFSDQDVNAVTSGKLKGNLNLSTDEKGNATVAFDGDINALSIDKTPIQNQQVTLGLTAAASAKLDRASASLNLKSAYANVDAKEVSVNLAQGISPLKMVEKATLNIGMKDFANAYALVNALVPAIKLPYTPTSGGVAIVAKVEGPNTSVDIKASRLQLKNVKGQEYAFNPKQQLSIVADLQIKGDQKIDSITVSKLESDLDVVKLAMNEPIVVTNLSTSPAVKGNITASGTLDRAAPLIQFLQQAEKMLPYRGAFTFKNNLDTSGTITKLVMDGAVDDFQLLDDQNKPSFSEKQVKLDGTIFVDPSKQVAQIQLLNINMASSNAVKANVSGEINQFSSPMIGINNVVVKADGDGAKIWPIVFPLLPPEQQIKLKEAAFKGAIKLAVTVNGAYYAGTNEKPALFHESINQLTVNGDATLPDADLSKSYGITTSNFRQIFSLNKGILVTGDTSKPKGDPNRFAPPFTVNETGQGDLGSIVINLGDPAMPVTIGRKQVLLKDVKINQVMTSQLGSAASVFFKDSKNATGMLKLLQVVECNEVPIADLMSGNGEAQFLYSVDELQLDGPVPSGLSDVLGWGKQGIVGNIQNGSLMIKNGVAYQEMTLNIQKMVEAIDPQTNKPGMQAIFEQLQMKGGINLKKGKFENYSLWLSKGLLRNDWQKSFPNGATVALNGDVNNVTGIITQTLTQLGLQGATNNILDDLLNKNKRKDRDKER